MTNTTTAPSATDTDTRTLQVFRVYIQATPEKIWEAITSPEWNGRYGYHVAATYDLQPGGIYDVQASPEMEAMGMQGSIIDGEVLEVDPPNRLVQTYRFKFSPEQEAEGYTTLTWDIFKESDKLSRLTITHDVTDAPIVDAMVRGAGDEKVNEGGGGWAWILSDLKSLLESGNSIEL